MKYDKEYYEDEANAARNIDPYDEACEKKFGEIWDAEEKRGYTREQAFIRAQYICDGQTPPEYEKPEKEDTRTVSELTTSILKGWFPNA